MCLIEITPREHRGSKGWYLQLLQGKQNTTNKKKYYFTSLFISGQGPVWQMVKIFPVYSREAKFLTNLSLADGHPLSPQKPTQNVDNDLCSGKGSSVLHKVMATEVRKRPSHSWERWDRTKYSTTASKLQFECENWRKSHARPAKQASNTLLQQVMACIRESVLAKDRNGS